MKYGILVGKVEDHNLCLVNTLGIEGPAECTSRLATSAAEGYFSLTSIFNLPHDELLSVANSCDSHIVFTVLAELKDFNNLNKTPSIAERGIRKVVYVVPFQRGEVKNAKSVSLSLFNKEYLIILSLKDFDIFASQIWYLCPATLRALKCIWENQQVGVIKCLHGGPLAIFGELSLH